jgi:hypothetical protein
MDPVDKAAITRCVQMGREMCSGMALGAGLGCLLGATISGAGTLAAYLARPEEYRVDNREIIVISTIGLAFTGLFLRTIQHVIEQVDSAKSRL